MGENCSNPTTVYQDNLGAIRWTEEVQGLRNVKHVVLRYQFVRESVETRQVEVVHTSSATNWFDSLTKALVSDTFELHRQMLGVFPSSPRGGVSKKYKVMVTMDEGQTM